MITVGAATGFAAVTKTAAYTANPGELVLANATAGAFTITLPATAPANGQVQVKKTDTSSNPVTVVGAGAATIDGDPSCVLMASEAAATLAFDGTNWQVVNTANINTGTDSLQTAMVPTYTSGLWYDRRGVLNLPIGLASATPGAAGSSVIAPSTAFYFPCYAHRAVAINTVAFATGGTAATAGVTVRFGLYANTTANQPGTRLYDWGAISPTLTVNTASQMAAAGTIPAGWSWWAISLNATSIGSMLALNTAVHPGPGIGATLPNPTWAYASQVVAYYETPATAGTLNATATPIALTPTQSSNILTPNIWFKVA